MELSDINPHIRYAKDHHVDLGGRDLTICYDCRLFFVRTGHGTLTADGVPYAFSHNTAVFLPPKTRYRFRFDGGEEITLLTFNFDLINEYAYLQDSLGTASEQSYSEARSPRYELPPEFAGVVTTYAPQLYELLDRCVAEFSSRDYLFREASSAILKLCLLELLKKRLPETDSRTAEKILEYIRENCHVHTLSNREIAAHFSYHPYYLSSLMKRTTGLTLHQQLLRFRIEMAKRYLRTTDLDINTVSWKSGFRTPAYFIKLFREQTGATPGSYRRAHLHDLL